MTNLVVVYAANLCLFSSLLGLSIELIGRRGTMMVTSIPFMLGWMLIAYAAQVSAGIAAVIAGRILTGFCCGIISLAAPVYIAETVAPSMRGFLGSGFQLAVTIGVLLVYVSGKYLSWAWLAMVSCSYPFALLVAMCFMPESPAW